MKIEVKMISTNWPAPNAWVFIAQLVELCNANANANANAVVQFPLKPRNIFGHKLHIAQIAITTATVISLFIFICQINVTALRLLSIPRF